jgi:hypothetical protein
VIFEAISALLAAVSIVLSRLDRHHDDAMATPDLRSGLLQLDGLLEDWLVAAKTTNASAATYSASDNDLDRLRHRSAAMRQDALAHMFRKKVQSPLGADSDVPVDRDTASLRRLFEIYAPAESSHIAEWTKSRHDLLNRMLQDLAQARQMQTPAEAEMWEAQLRGSYDNLLQAQRELREFIRSYFPLSDPS